MTATPQPVRRGSRRRSTKVLVGLLLAVVVLMLLAVAAALFPPLRQQALVLALTRLDTTLPGDLQLTTVHWPALKRLELKDVNWTHQDSTLLVARHIEIVVDLAALYRRDLVLETVKVHGLGIDVAAIAAAMYSRGAAQKAPPRGKARPVLRGGALPGVPSFSIGNLELTADWVRTGSRHTMTGLEIAAELDFRFDHAPRLHIERARAQGPPDGWRVDSLALDLDLAHGLASGKGTGRIQSRWPAFLQITATGPDRFTVHVAADSVTTIPQHMGMRAEVHVARRGIEVDSLQIQAVARTPSTVELGRIAALAPHLNARPESEGLALTAHATLALQPEPTLRLVTDFMPHPRLQRGQLAFKRGHEAWQLRVTGVQLDDLQVNALLEADAESLRAHADVAAAGMRWFAWVHPGSAPAIVLQASGEWQKRRGTKSAEVRFGASGRYAGLDVDQLHLEGEIGLDSLTISTLQVHAASHDVHVRGAAAIRAASTLQIRLGPVVLDTQAGTVLPVPPEDAGLILYTPRSRSLRVENLQVRGGAGDAIVSGSLDANRTGTYRARLSWPRFPGLLARAGVFTGSGGDSLRARWTHDAPYWLEIAGQRFSGGKTSSSGSFTFPGPRTFASLLPALNVGSFGRFEGSVRVDTEPHPDGTQLEVQVDGGQTAWIETLRLHLSGTPQDLQVRAAIASLDSTRVEIEGTIREKDVDLRCSYAVNDTTFLRQLLARANLTAVWLEGVATITGPRRAVTMDATLRGNVAAAGCNAAGIATQVHRDSSGMRTHLVIERGLDTPWGRVESVRASFDAGKDGVPPTRLSLHVQGKDFEIEQSARIARSQDWSVDVDTLRVVLQGKDLRATRPFRLTTSDTRVEIDSLVLAGSLGNIRAHGWLSRYDAAFDAYVRLELPEKPPLPAIPLALWPRHAVIDLHAEALDALRLQGDVAGVRLAGGANADLQLQLATQDGRLTASVVMRDGARTYIEGTVASPMRLRLFPPAARLEPGAIATDLRFTALPFAFHTTRTRGTIGPEDVARVGGRVVLGGTTTGLAGYAQADIAFPDSPHLADFTVVLLAQCGSDARADSVWGVSPRPRTDATHAPEDLALELSIATATADLIRGTASYPLRLSCIAPYANVDDTGSMALKLRAEEIPLAPFDPFLPPGATLNGKMSFSFDAEGDARDPRLAGSLRTSDVEFLLRDEVRIVFSASSDVSGTRTDPRLVGRVDVKSGLIHVPESKKELHPSEGKSILLTEAIHPVGVLDASATRNTLVIPLGNAASDSVAAPTITAPANQTLSRTDLEITIDLPRGLWVRGRGLDVELSGRLQVTQQHGKPVLIGELRAVRGTYSLIGRTFELDRGTVKFHGDDSMDPNLDIQMSTLVSSTKALVVVGGTIQKPALSLHSEPEMEQTDIIALLALGKTFDQLSDEESNIMRERATAIVLSMGVATLQENVTGELGIDVVQYRSDSAAPGGTSASDARVGSLAFGKYLSPRLLLSYAYSLDRTTDDVLSLEYFLRGRLTLETLYSVGGETGLGFGWTKEY